MFSTITTADINWLHDIVTKIRPKKIKSIKLSKNKKV